MKLFSLLSVIKILVYSCVLLLGITLAWVLSFIICIILKLNKIIYLLLRDIYILTITSLLIKCALFYLKKGKKKNLNQVRAKVWWKRIWVWVINCKICKWAVIFDLLILSHQPPKFSIISIKNFKIIIISKYCHLIYILSLL